MEKVKVYVFYVPSKEMFNNIGTEREENLTKLINLMKEQYNLSFVTFNDNNDNMAFCFLNVEDRYKAFNEFIAQNYNARLDPFPRKIYKRLLML